MDFSKLLEMSVFEVMETMEIDIKKAKSLRRSAALSVVPKTVTVCQPVISSILFIIYFLFSYLRLHAWLTHSGYLRE